jgi:hypothetical protein
MDKVQKPSKSECYTQSPLGPREIAVKYSAQVWYLDKSGFNVNIECIDLNLYVGFCSQSAASGEGCFIITDWSKMSHHTVCISFGSL